MKVIELKLSRLISGSPGEVFDVWFDPECPGGPWHGAKKVIMNLARDGLFYFGLDRAEARSKNPAIADRGEILGHFGRFTALERPRAAEHTWMSEHTLGHAAESEAALQLEIADNAQGGAYQIAEVYAWRGETDKAFEWLERGFDQRDGGLSFIHIDPLLASLRSDARYRALLDKMGLPR